VVENGLDVKVWKELAISKQMMIRTATDALGLDPECKEDELKTALKQGIDQISEAKSTVDKAKEENRLAIAEMEKNLDVSEKSRVKAEKTIDELTEKCESLQTLLDSTRKTSADELKKITATLDDKNRALKNINVMLADTPENVVKKLKVLNKKKFDEATARKRSEGEVRALKKDKQELQKKNTTLDSTLEKSNSLVDKYRELRAFSEDQYTQLKGLVEDEKELTELPELDDELLESLEAKE
jgi:colicin import membrane protein